MLPSCSTRPVAVYHKLSIDTNTITMNQSYERMREETNYSWRAQSADQQKKNGEEAYEVSSTVRKIHYHRRAINRATPRSFLVEDARSPPDHFDSESNRCNDPCCCEIPAFGTPCEQLSDRLDERVVNLSDRPSSHRNWSVRRFPGAYFSAKHFRGISRVPWNRSDDRSLRSAAIKTTRRAAPHVRCIGAAAASYYAGDRRKHFSSARAITRVLVCTTTAFSGGVPEFEPDNDSG